MSVSLSERSANVIDRLLSGRTGSQMGVLFVVSALVVVFVAVLRLLFTEVDVFSALRWALVALLDPTAFAGEEQPASVLLGIGASLLGLVVVASLIGLVTASLERRLQDLQKGRTRVVVRGHTLILCGGAFPRYKVVQILRELRFREGAPRVAVILSEEKKGDVEDALACEPFPGLDVLVRTGSSFNPSSLLIAGADRARSVILLNPTLDSGATNGAGDDNEILKSTSQLVILRTILPCRLDHVIMSETLARLLVQTCRVRGLSQVLADLLTFQGSELYFGAKFPPELDGLAWGAVQERIYDAIVCGFSRDDKVVLNPNVDVILCAATDRLLVLSESGTSWKVGPPRQMTDLKRPFRKSRKQKKELVCVVGTSSSLDFIVKEFDSYFDAGSQLHLLGGKTSVKPENAKIVHFDGHQNDLASLSRLLEQTPDSIIVISNDGLKHSDADALTISTVLLLDHLLKQRESKEGKAKASVRIICEILDSSSKDLLDQNVGVEFVLSAEITTRLISQISVDGKLLPVFDELFTPEGNEVYVKDVAFYTGGKREIPWLNVLAQARSVGETAMGISRKNGAESELNPPHSLVYKPEPGDGLIVCAESDDELEFVD